jgi:hypothetical protein
MRHVAHMGDKTTYKILVMKPEEKRPLDSHMCRWEGNINMDLKETGCEDVDWIQLIQDKVQCEFFWT